MIARQLKLGSECLQAVLSSFNGVRLLQLCGSRLPLNPWQEKTDYTPQRAMDTPQINGLLSQKGTSNGWLRGCHLKKCLLPLRHLLVMLMSALPSNDTHQTLMLLILLGLVDLPEI